MKNISLKLSLLLAMTCLTGVHALGNEKKLLEIHYINVAQGGSTLIIGPNGTRILYDFGNKAGDISVVPYLDSLGWSDKNIHYSILSHRDQDHFYGYKGIVESGYEFTISNYKNGGKAKKGKRLKSHWKEIAAMTKAGPAVAIKPGLDISLGEGASLFVAASAGVLFDGKEVKVRNENDFSVSLLLSYGDFQMILDGDLGSGPEVCSGRNTSQAAVQQEVINALIYSGRLKKETGVDIIHIAHHGSESSTSAEYLSLAKPEIGVVSVGNPNCSYRHPHKNVMDLMEQRTQTHTCDTPIKPLIEVYQTDMGSENCSNGKPGAQNSGIIGGDIIVKTDGVTEYSIETTGILWKNGRRTFLENFKIPPASYLLDEQSSND